MRLADFIEAEMEAILLEWEGFARTLLPASGGMNVDGLRDHAEQILHAIAKDLRTSQTRGEQITKSRGEAVRARLDPESAAETHGYLRASSGFTLQQLVAEYRALRASVLKLWADAIEPDRNTVTDMTRFNEAIDQAVAESVDFFAAETERWRNVFLGVLGHDLRGPLNAILLTTRLLSHVGSEEPVKPLIARLTNGGERMKRLLDDLLDYSRASAEQGIPVAPVPMDLTKTCAEEVELQRAIWPSHEIALVNAEVAIEGEWDPARLKQVLGNLISNAAKYGNRDGKITVRLDGNEKDAMFSVENSGPTIAAAGMKALFQPFKRDGHLDDVEAERASLGLGLFIVSHVVKAHGGTVALSSGDGRTVFTVTLPRKPAPAPA